MYMFENFAHGRVSPCFFEFISASTCTYFGKYAHVFPQIFLHISVNKFDAGLKMRALVVFRMA